MQTQMRTAMTQQVQAKQQPRGGDTETLTIRWAAETNEEGGPTRWLGSWLVAGAAVEGSWFYGGYGSEQTAHPIPAGATGIRVRKWLSEGLDPEYVDLPLTENGPVDTAALDFDSPQPHRIFHPAGT